MRCTIVSVEGSLEPSCTANHLSAIDQSSSVPFLTKAMRHIVAFKGRTAAFEGTGVEVVPLLFFGKLCPFSLLWKDKTCHIVALLKTTPVFCCCCSSLWFVSFSTTTVSSRLFKLHPVIEKIAARAYKSLGKRMPYLYSNGGIMSSK